jgi:hypothetical protein
MNSYIDELLADYAPNATRNGLEIENHEQTIEFHTQDDLIEWLEERTITALPLNTITENIKLIRPYAKPAYLQIKGTRIELTQEEYNILIRDIYANQ